jgi:hypothetical protein
VCRASCRVIDVSPVADQAFSARIFKARSSKGLVSVRPNRSPYSALAASSTLEVAAEFLPPGRGVFRHFWTDVLPATGS